jgi:hypothetical protein
VQKTIARIVYGGLGGSSGAACMTIVRMMAHRRRLIDKTVAQTMEEWAAARSGISVFRAPVIHHVADQVMHHGYGAVLGAIYGLLLGRQRNRKAAAWLVRGGGFGLATWLLGSWVVLPALGAKSSPSHQHLTPVGIDLTSHLAYGLVTAMICDELRSQDEHRPKPDSLGALARVG